MNQSDFSWLNFNYLTFNELMSYEWANVYYLYLIPIIPFLFIVSWMVFLRYRPKLNIILPKSYKSFDWTVYLRYIPTFFLLLFIEFVLIALARPQKTAEIVNKTSEGIEIMLALDISESMLGLDFEPNRLESAKKVAIDFVNGRHSDRIGVVVFSGEAFTLCPLTSDYEMLKTMISNIHYGMIDKDGTAIGLAIASATNRMREVKSKTKIMILISDGENNAGQLDPITAAQLANAFNVKIYTIAVGKNGDVEYRDENGQIYTVDNQLDESNLKQIASIGQGKFERAINNLALKQIFKQIDKMEKSETKVQKIKNTTEFYDVYLFWAMLFFLIWLALKSTFMSNVLVD